MHQCDKVRQVLQPENCALGCNLPFFLLIPPCCATCKISSQGHPSNQGIVPACYLQHARCSHRPSSKTAHIQVRTCFCFFFPAPFLTAESRILGLFYWAVSRHWTKRVGHFYPGGSGIARELAKSKPELPAGLGGWVWGLGQELGPERIIPFNIGKMGAVLVGEADGKGLQGSMGQLGRPSVD